MIHISNGECLQDVSFYLRYTSSVPWSYDIIGSHRILVLFALLLLNHIFQNQNRMGKQVWQSVHQEDNGDLLRMDVLKPSQCCTFYLDRISAFSSASLMLLFPQLS